MQEKIFRTAGYLNGLLVVLNCNFESSKITIRKKRTYKDVVG